MQVASVTRQGEIIEMAGTAVPFGDGMLDVVSGFAKLLVQAPILTTKVSPLAD